MLDYATGALSEGWSIAIATHLALCPACRDRLALAEAAGGALLETAAPVALASDSWDRLRARLGDTPPVTPAPPRPAPVRAAPDRLPVRAVLPQPLRDYVGGDLDSLRWKPLGRGAYHIPIQTADRSVSARLLRIPAGRPVPEHSHGGRELTLVLKGAFRDGDDLFARGDLEEADEHLNHQPIATEDEDCICLAITDAPLRFRSWVVRMVQPILGI